MTTLRSLRGAKLDLFCLGEEPFFTDPFSAEEDASSVVWGPLPPQGWERIVTRGWTQLSPLRPIREQGWKVHVAATKDGANEILERVSAYCFANSLHFKYLSSPHVFDLMNSKHAARQASGKFVTIYPGSEIELDSLLHDLGRDLQGFAGPYILSDRRWGDGPLHVRYGAFKRIVTQDEIGHDVLALRRPDGTLEADRREPFFTTPDWVPDASFPVFPPAGDPTVVFNYNISEALHFSNGGGVYKAVRRSDGAECILKEARPHAGLDSEGVDAVARLEREASVLQALSEGAGAPRLLEKFTAWEHSFLALELLSGVSLLQWIAENSPESRTGPDDGDRAAYGRICELILDRLRGTVASLHAEGWIHGDIHPGNIMVDEDLDVRLLDFEQACTIASPRRPGLGVPAFVRTRHGSREFEFEDDLFAIAAVGLWLFTPLIGMMPFRSRFVLSRVNHIKERFSLSENWAQYVGGTLKASLDVELKSDLNASLPGAVGSRTTSPDGQLIGEAVESLKRHIEGNHSSKGLGRPLVQGDIHQVLTDDVNISSGLAGVVFALEQAGAEVAPLTLRALEGRSSQLTHPGLLCGQAGAAMVFGRVGLPTVREALMDQAVQSTLGRRDMTLATGSAGVVLALLAAGPGSHASAKDIAAAVKVAQGFKNGLVHKASTPTGLAAGFAEGHSGAAVACARLSVVTGDRQWLDSAVELLERDLSCTRIVHGMRLLDEDGILYPYLAHGSAGIAVAYGELQSAGAGLPQDTLHELIAALDVSATAEPGLYDGGLGLAAALQHLKMLGLPISGDRIKSHLDSAADYLVPTSSGIALAGRGLRALSFDFSTGLAGWIAVASAIANNSTALPGLQPLIAREARYV